MSVEEFETLGLSEDSDLMLVNGIVYSESGCEEDVTKRNRYHARIELLVGQILQNWVDKTRFPGKTFSGEVGCVLSQDGISVGIDVALFDDATLEQVARDSVYLTGPPLLAVEILSPSDQIESIERKIQGYLDSGVRQVWIISPGMRNVTVHSPDQDPKIYPQHSTMDGGNVLAGFSEPVSRFFE